MGHMTRIKTSNGFYVKAHCPQARHIQIRSFALTTLKAVPLKKIRVAGLAEMQGCHLLPQERWDPREAQPRLIRARPPQPRHSRTPPKTPVEALSRLFNQVSLQEPIETTVQALCSLLILSRAPAPFGAPSSKLGPSQNGAGATADASSPRGHVQFAHSLEQNKPNRPHKDRIKKAKKAEERAKHCSLPSGEISRSATP